MTKIIAFFVCDFFSIELLKLNSAWSIEEIFCSSYSFQDKLKGTIWIFFIWSLILMDISFSKNICMEFPPVHYKQALPSFTFG